MRDSKGKVGEGHIDSDRVMITRPDNYNKI